MQQLLVALLLCLLLPAASWAESFSLTKKNSPQPGPTVLLIGGIHGDEPGGFNAAALLQTRYRLTSGSLWIVPDLNRTSILRRAHGWHGDLNYKFNGLNSTDPDYPLVQEIKKLLTAPEVELIFNLHDGSGYYHPQNISRQQNPRRWGQSLVIDQATLPGARFGNLQQLSDQAAQRLNQQLLNPQHRFRVKNTRTASSDEVMQRTLTYFAVRNGKPAFALEASKLLPTHLRVYYLLGALEAYFQQIGIGFERDFPLTPQAVQKALTEEVEIAFGARQIVLPLTNLRPTLPQFPLEKRRSPSVQADNPLVSLRKEENRYRIHFGNNRLAYLLPKYVDYDHSLKGINLTFDQRREQVVFGSKLRVETSISIEPIPGYQIEVYGERNPPKPGQTSRQLTRAQLDKSASVDNDGTIFRLEVYRQEKFCGMILVEFSSDK